LIILTFIEYLKLVFVDQYGKRWNTTYKENLQVMTQNKQTGSIIIHGGFSDELTDDWDIIENKRMALAQIIQKGYEFLETDAPVVEVASRIIMLIEDNPLFNAGGKGGKIQEDGMARFSASIMVGDYEDVLRKFAGVINIDSIEFPSQVVCQLLKRRKANNAVLSGIGATDYAHKIGISFFPFTTKERAEEWQQIFGNDDSGLKHKKTSTVGVVISTPEQPLIAMTSTGGTTGNWRGRVGDSGLPAGNYAGSHVAVSCTGFGEEIINTGLASSIHSLVELGKMDLTSAVQAVFSKCENFPIGAIIVDRKGKMICTDSQIHSYQYMMWAKHDGENIEISGHKRPADLQIGHDRKGEIITFEKLKGAMKMKFEPELVELPAVTKLGDDSSPKNCNRD
jgi:L-asparaginase